MWGQGIYGESLYLSLSFTVDLKLPPKINYLLGKTWWCTSVIPATWEAEIEKIIVLCQHGKKLVTPTSAK
jgi:hypothetical protein